VPATVVIQVKDREEGGPMVMVMIGSTRTRPRCATRRSVVSPHSGQGWEELSLDLKGEGDNSMPGNRRLMPRRMGWRAGGSA
jgi:hypothetical protein